VIDARRILKRGKKGNFTGKPYAKIAIWTFFRLPKPVIPGRYTVPNPFQMKPADLEREIATLRHMEKVRGELIVGKKIIRPW
jgi:hypothetical protein